MQLRSVLVLPITIGLLCGVAHAGNDRTEKLIGSWSCSTYQGNITNKTIARDRDGSMRIVNRVHTANGDFGTIRETYVPDASGGWKLTAIPDPVFPFGRYDATAGAWTGTQWVFEGSEPMRAADGSTTLTDARLVYTDVFPAGFRRELQVQASGIWRDISEEVCTR